MSTCDPHSPCPCGRADARAQGLPYAQCCGRWLEGDTPAPDAESLMRSRYSAFVLQRAPYLLRTWHASKRPSQITFDAGVQWLGLEVRAHQVLGPEQAEVEFVARQRSPGGRAVRLHERSRFVREEGHWYYVDGEHR